MANRLTKIGIFVQYPAVPADPGRPAYCVEKLVPKTVERHVPPKVGSTGGGSSSYQNMGPPGPDWGAVYDGPPRRAKPTVEYETVYLHAGWECYDAVPPSPGVPARSENVLPVGWNGGARSIDSFDHDGFVSFQLPLRPLGVVAGLATTDNSPAFNEASHAVYGHGTTIEIVEYGQVVAQAPVSPATLPTITIVRSGGVVTYYVGDWFYRSARESVGRVHLDAALYATGDFVDAPKIGSLGGAPVLPVHGVLATESPRLAGKFGEAYAQLTGRAPRLTGQFSLRRLATLDGTAPALRGLFGESAYAQLVGRLPRLGGQFDGGFPQVNVAILTGVGPHMSGAFVSKVGAVGHMNTAAPRVFGKFSDRPYADMAGTQAGKWFGYFDEGPAPGGYGRMEFLWLLAEVSADPVIFASIHDTLGIASSASFALVFDVSYFDGLLLTDTLTLEQILEAVIRERLVLHSGVATTRTAALQYAVNIATGALTTYQNFDFHGFTHVEATKRTYGWRPDGVYEIGGSTDDGARLNALLDLGATDFETSRKKYVPAVFLGLGTDGCAYLRLTGDDGCERVYRVIQREDISRANPAQGLAAREWHTVLEIADATKVDFDSIEWAVEVTSRRWTR